MYKYFKKIGNTELISEWKSTGLSDEFIAPRTTSNNSLAPTLKYSGKRMHYKFNGRCLKQDKITFNHGKIVNIYIVHVLISTLNYNRDITLENCFITLSGAVKLTKNVDIDKYKFSGYGIGFDGKGTFLFPDGGFAQNVITFGVDMSSSVHVDNQKKDILIPGEGPTQGLDDTTLTAEKMYSINFTVPKRKFCLSLHYNEADSCLFVNGTEIVTFKPRDSEIVANSLCLENMSKDFSVANMKKTVLVGSVFDSSVDYKAIAFDDILDILKYLMKKNI